MEGFVRRIRAVYSAKHAEASPVEIQKESRTPQGVTRREFFKNYAAPAGAAVVMDALPTIVHEDMALAASVDGAEGIRERERVVENKVRIVRDALFSETVRSAMRGEGINPFIQVLRAMQFPLTPQFIKGTKFDMEQMAKQHCVQMAYESRGEGKPYFVQWIANKIRSGFKTHAQAGYGNGVFFGALDRFLTARHIDLDSQQKPLMLGKLDISWMFTGAMKANREQVIHDDPTLTNTHIDGSFVSIEGIDPDETSESDGYKSYPGVAVKLSRAFVDRVFINAPADMKELLYRSFMVAIPRGEGTGAPRNKPGTGMSGAPVFTLHNGNRVLAGTMFSISSHADTALNTSYDFAFFHGIEEVRTRVQEQTRSGV